MEYISREYGSKKGFLRLLKSRVILATGGYNDLFSIDFSRIERLVFVCKGNICRSAYAEAYARSLGIKSVSCGIEAAENKPADARAVVQGLSRGVSLESHRTRHLNSMVLLPTDLMLGMEPGHLMSMRRAASGAQVSLLGLWSPQSSRPYLHDPYISSDSYFVTCCDFIEKCIMGLQKAGAVRPDQLPRYSNSIIDKHTGQDSAA